jgi:mRNA interferase RelE/StbE
LRDRIVTKIEAYADNPAAFAKIKSLQGRDGLRLRVGDWRVTVASDGDTITVRQVGHRSEIYE